MPIVDARVDQTVRWDPVNAATGYRVQLGSGGSIVKTVELPTPEIAIAVLCEGLPVDTKYSFQLQAMSDYGDSAWSETFEFMLRVLDTPRGLRLK